MNTQDGDNAELHCEYHAPAASKVTWQKDGKQLDTSSDVGAKYFVKSSPVKNGKSTSVVLRVKNVQKTDLGDYKCKVENDIGSQDVNITLTFKPEPPTLQAPIERDGEYTITHWHIRSMQPIHEVMLKYRRKDVSKQTVLIYIQLEIDFIFEPGDLELSVCVCARGSNRIHAVDNVFSLSPCNFHTLFRCQI